LTAEILSGINSVENIPPGRFGEIKGGGGSGSSCRTNSFISKRIGLVFVLSRIGGIILALPEAGKGVAESR
jgi:hypothetical protein